MFFNKYPNEYPTEDRLPWNFTPWAGINAPAGWKHLTDAPNVIVAVIDTGILDTHEDLQDNMFGSLGNNLGTNAHQIHGFSALNDDQRTTDNHGHGTKVAGVVGARGNNDVGTVGVAWKVQLMPCKFTNYGDPSFGNVIACITHAVNNGAKIINCSFSFLSETIILRKKIHAFEGVIDGLRAVIAKHNDIINQMNGIIQQQHDDQILIDQTLIDQQQMATKKKEESIELINQYECMIEDFEEKIQRCREELDQKKDILKKIFNHTDQTGRKDVILVRSAGNGIEVNDQHVGQLFNAADIAHEDDFKGAILTVGASTKNGDQLRRASFANYGPSVVHLMAPGADIRTTSINNNAAYSNIDGTSIAAPHVAGALALMMARFPDATREQLIERLIATVTPMQAGETISEGQLNLANALRRDLLGTGPFSMWCYWF